MTIEWQSRDNRTVPPWADVGDTVMMNAQRPGGSNIPIPFRVRGGVLCWIEEDHYAICYGSLKVRLLAHVCKISTCLRDWATWHIMEAVHEDVTKTMPQPPNQA